MLDSPSMYNTPSPDPLPDPPTLAAICECPMCYHSVRNPCSQCGCPGSLPNGKEYEINCSTTSGSKHENPLPNYPPERVATPTRPLALPSSSIHHLYSQGRSISPHISTAPGESNSNKTNLYKPTSLQDFKKLISKPNKEQERDAHKSAAEDISQHSFETMNRNIGPTKKPSIFVDNRFSIIQEDPGEERRNSDDQMGHAGFLV